MKRAIPRFYGLIFGFATLIMNNNCLGEGESQPEITLPAVVLADKERVAILEIYATASGAVQTMVCATRLAWPLGVPTTRERVAQTAAKLVPEPVFETDFDDGAYDKHES